MNRILFILIACASIAKNSEGQSLNHFHQLMKKSIKTHVRTLFTEDHALCFNQSAWFYQNEIIPDPVHIMNSTEYFEGCTVNTMNETHCDLKGYKKHVARPCSFHGGQPMLLDVKTICQSGNRTNTTVLVHNMPLCFGRSCDRPMVVDILNSMEVIEEGCKYIFSEPKDPSCERPDSRFVLDRTNNVTRSCKWLRQDRARIEKYCVTNHTKEHRMKQSQDGVYYELSNRHDDHVHDWHREDDEEVEYHQEKGGAYESCPFACSRYNLFVKRIWLKGENVVAVKRCKWLALKSRSYKKWMCKKKLWFGNVGPASVMCPHICARDTCRI